MVAADGGIFNFGDAGFFGSMGGQPLNEPIVGMATTSDGGGYWGWRRTAASSASATPASSAPWAAAPQQADRRHRRHPTGRATGRWRDGGIFAFGDARFDGSTGALHLNQPIVGMAATADGAGYWFVASDGGIFNFGDAPFFGSAGSLVLPSRWSAWPSPPVATATGSSPPTEACSTTGARTDQAPVPGSGVHVTNIVGGALPPSPQV